MSDKDRWIEITVNTSHEAVEAVAAIFSECGIESVSIEDTQDIIDSNTSPHEWDYIEERLIPKDTDEVKVKGYILEGENVNSTVDRIKGLVANLGEFGIDRGKGEVSAKEVKEEDWANCWKEYYKPFKIGEHIVIKPSWESYKPEEDDIVVELDPGMAFGTGSHETTRMCIELLDEYIRPGYSVYDVGCGSGILSIVASKLGAKGVLGIDRDPAAVKSASENIKISKSSNVEIKHGNLLDLVHERADIIVANIIADVIINLCRDIPAFLEKGGVFICSGIINDRLSDVESALTGSGFKILQVKKLGEWAAVAASVREQCNA